MQVGVDIGSTTTKIVAVDQKNNEIIFSKYKRHNAHQIQSVYELLRQFEGRFPDQKVKFVLTGSGAKLLSEKTELPYIQEVVANSIALKKVYNNVGTAIELGGQDAKMIFFHKESEEGAFNVSDMRMNGSCAGGTGAFLDEIASVLNIPVEQLNELASKGQCVYDISGRCGVYAKTDIQPLVNQGVLKEDLALSSFHAIAKQTIGGLAQGLDIEKPVAFEGGPLTFNPELVRVFAERLGLEKEDILIPEHPELMVAYGAALSAETMFDEKQNTELSEIIHRVEIVIGQKNFSEEESGIPFFSSEKERMEFEETHRLKKTDPHIIQSGDKMTAYLGIDSGSTTTKFALMDENENLLETFYASNEGNPLMVAKNALIGLREKYKKAGATLNILGVCTTGYGEQLFARAFSAECHVVETVAHVRGVERYVKDASFILDIGGQDMKAIWLNHGVITNIVVNEACSSGCGSFLENFASTLHIPVEKIGETAFLSRHPANLGSRCTVFMTSSIVTAQRNGKLPEDIMAGLCRSVIENVFTKVIRVNNIKSLGENIVVQGGTFQNDAVLCAMEQYIGRKVTRAPYPGLMGAIGAALIAKERMQKEGTEKTFIGLDCLDDFSYEQETNVICPNCGNHCKRTIVRFSNGNTWVTNNRCERGEILDLSVKRIADPVPDMFKVREALLIKDYPFKPVAEEKDIVIGIPKVLSFWEILPFWKTFFRTLGFKVKVSGSSSRAMYERGLSAVTSDTVCFPAKLVHGHLRSLVDMGVDHIFFPSITTVKTENKEETSVSMCAVVKGYPIVIRNSDNVERKWGVPLHTPLFHWYTDEDRKRQLCRYMKDKFDIPESLTVLAIEAGDIAQDDFHSELKRQGQKIIDSVKKSGTYAVILASRPYQNDSLVNHNLSEMFTGMGIPVLTADSVPGTENEDLHRSRLDIVNNFHARMLSCSIAAAKSPYLEYVQIVSFGCGHDAYLSDEIIRVMNDISGKAPLVLKVDETDIKGPLRIRVRSFIETVNMRRNRRTLELSDMREPYPVKFKKDDRKKKVVLVPNTSHAFCRLMSAAFCKQGISAEPLELGREEAIHLGKQYVNNDICFPAQMVIGEALAALKSGKYDADHVAIGMGKYIGDCRLTHYGALLRKALDDAGFKNVPILTNDDVDYHQLHPGFKLDLFSSMRIAFGLPMIDVLEELLRKIRPYEKIRGSADIAFEKGIDAVMRGLESHGIRGAAVGFKKAIDMMNNIEYDRTEKRPQVLIVGEYLLNFHPGANHDIELYLERNGFEIIEARMTDVIRKSYFYKDMQIKEYHVKASLKNKMWLSMTDEFFDLAHNLTDRIAKSHPLYEPACRLTDLVKESDSIFHHTFDAGEGVLIPGEIIHHAKKGCKAFVVLQPFGCLPNHIVGRGIIKRLKEMYPNIQILPLDYDPDISFANIENRLQMLIMNVKSNMK